MALICLPVLAMATYPPERDWAQLVPNALENADFRQMDESRGQPARWYFFTNGSNANWSQIEEEGKPGIRLSHSDGAPAFFMYGGYNTNEMVDLRGIKKLIFTVQAKAIGSAEGSIFMTFRNAENAFLQQVEMEPTIIDNVTQELRLAVKVPDAAVFGNFALRIHEGMISFTEPELALLPRLQDFTLTVNVDYADLCYFSPGLGYPEGFTEQAIIRMIDDFAKAGVDRMHWRVTLFGLPYYWSELSEVFPGSRYDPSVDAGRQRLATMLQQFDPLRVAIREAKRHGIELFIWKDIYDEWGATEEDSFASQFLLDNPDFQTTTRDGLERFKGMLSYNFEAVRAYRLAELDELLAYEPDGIYYSTRTHAFNLRTDAGDEFGFEQPVVDAYQARYGVDLRQNFFGWYPPFNKDAWRALRAEGLTKLIEAASARCEAHGVDFLLGVKDPRFERFGWPYGNAILPWHSYFEQGWVDGIVTEHGLGDVARVAAYSTAFIEQNHGEEAAVYYWMQVYDFGANQLLSLEALLAQFNAMRVHPVRGTVLHQDVNLLGSKRLSRLEPIARFVRNYLKPYPDSWWDWAAQQFTASQMDGALSWGEGMTVEPSGKPLLLHYLYDVAVTDGFALNPLTVQLDESGWATLHLNSFNLNKGVRADLEWSHDLVEWSSEMRGFGKEEAWTFEVEEPPLDKSFWRVVWRWE